MMKMAEKLRIPQKFHGKNLRSPFTGCIVKDYIKPWKDENGIQYIGIEDFLLDEKSLW